MSSSDNHKIRNVAFVATRVHGTDGVSLEIGKWTSVLEHLGYDCFYLCGKSDRPENSTFLIDKADFHHPEIQQIHQQVFGTRYRTRELSDQIRSLAGEIKDQIYEAIDKLSIDLFIAQNSLTIPLNIPLGAALVEVLMETHIPCIAHHHDFAWERGRFLINSVTDYLNAVFPPKVAGIDHVVISTLAGEEFGRRTGLPYRVIPNVMDFAHPPEALDDYAKDFRQAVGLSDEDIMILQPTRVVARKGIEHTIELVHRLKDPRCKLVITHDGIDEGSSYAHRIRQFSDMLNVKTIFADQMIAAERQIGQDGRKKYSIWDIYPHADLVAYPSSYEGFGNAFLEAVYYRKPIFCNHYTIFEADIDPCGFRTIGMDGFLTDEVVEQVRYMLANPEYRDEVVEHNYRTARKYFAYERVESELRSILDTHRPRFEPVTEKLKNQNPRGS